jgi:phosphomannomutase/phosphoglucomutase
MSGHMFFGGDYYGFDDACSLQRGCSRSFSKTPKGLASLLADLPKTFATPELRVDCPEELKFAIADRAVAHFAARYPVNTIDGVRMTFPNGWGLIRSRPIRSPCSCSASRPPTAAALAAYQAEVMGWLAEQGVRG